MRKRWMVLVAAAAALGITACGNGDGIVINGTTAGAVEGEERDSGSETAGETTSGTTIEIVTGETTPAMETAPESTEGQPETTAAPVETQPAQAQTSPSTQPATQPETTAAKVYKVTDLKKTMYATAAVRVRASYSTSSDVLAGLAKDEKVEVTGQSENGWLRVNYKGQTGYVSKDYLTETPPETAGGTGTGNAGETTAANNNSSGTTKPAGPTASGSGTSSGSTAGPGGSSGSTTTDQGSVGPGGAGSPEGSVSPGGTTSPGGSTGNSSSTGTGSTGQNSVTGSITSIDPTGVTVQTSDGTSYQFTWGGNTPREVAPGDRIQIFYETTSSGERRVTSYSK